MQSAFFVGAVVPSQFFEGFSMVFHVFYTVIVDPNVCSKGNLLPSGSCVGSSTRKTEKSQAETLAVLDDKLEDVHLSAFQPCGKAWQAAITCTLEKGG